MKLKVNTNPGYDVEIERGIVLEKGLPEGLTIVESNVAKIYNHLLKKDFMVIDSGEKNKSLLNCFRLLNNIPDTDHIIGLGGGATTDLVGFVASVLKRGTPLTLIPTTLTGMVDSSIGGKNGINLKEKKNYIGNFYQPKKVLIDPLFLDSLPDYELKNGTAEIIKYSFIFGQPPLERVYNRISVLDNDLDNIIAACCKVKASVVEKDEKDKGYRHTLNFGHTFAHALELLYNLSHGEAISIGMVKALELRERIEKKRQNKLSDLKKVLTSNGLPTEFPRNLDLEKFIENLRYDKKGDFIFVFDKDNYAVQLDEKTVRTFLENDN